MALKENYKDDILDVSQNVKRKYQMENNGDGTVSFTDVTEYTQQGDSFGASDLNAMAHAINNVSSDAEHTSYDNTTSGLVSDNVQGAIDEINDNLTEKVTKFSGTDSGNTYVTVDGLAYDQTNKKLGLKVNGADTVIPFSSDIKPMGVGTVTGSTNTFTLSSADVGSIYLMVYNSSTQVGRDLGRQIKDKWYELNVASYSISGGELLNSFSKGVDSDMPYYQKLFFVKATTSTITITSTVLSTYSHPRYCFAVKLT